MIGGQENVSEGIIQERQHDLPQHVLMVDDSAWRANRSPACWNRWASVHDGERWQAYDQLKAWLDEGRDVENWLALIISDVEMPRMDGYSLTKAIREHLATQSPARDSAYLAQWGIQQEHGGEGRRQRFPAQVGSPTPSQ